MKKINGLLGFGIFFILIFLCFGSSFLFQNQEKSYSELTISVNPKSDIAAVQKIAKDYGFKIKEHQFAFSTKNKFTEKHKIYIVYKYDIQPEELNSVLNKFKDLEAANIIETVEPNYRMEAFSNDPLFDKQWNLKTLEIEEVWKKGTGKGVTVAVIDTGISKKLNDLSPSRFVKGYNFADNNTDFEDLNGHGSHVAGTIGQDTDNNKGVAGIAYDSKLMPLKVLNEKGYGTTVDIAEAIVYAVENGADVINMSLGGGGYSEVLEDACQYAYDKDVIVIASAGNDNKRSSAYPARFNTVISVAATGPAYERAPYSNYGTGVDVIAPGGAMNRNMQDGILQNAPEFLSKKVKGYEKIDNDYFFYFQGTSMAAPHVSGIAAILYQKGVRKPADMRKLLISTADREIANLPFVNPLNAINNKKGTIKAPVKEPVKPSKPNINSGAITTSTLTSILSILLAVIMLFIFDKTRKKVVTIEDIHKPLTYLGLILGVNGLSLVGYFVQSLFPFSILPERFTGLLFNSILDWDRVLFFLSKPSILWHNFLIPVIFMIFLNFKDDRKRRFSVGLLLGFSAKFIADGIFIRELTLLPDGLPAIIFLVLNGLIAFILPYILVKK